jgi:hypothetical protein
MKYNPLKTPKPDDWLALDESERIYLVEVHHKRARVKLPNAPMHAIVHVTVENQLAEGYEVVRETLDRLMDEGLDRHDAIHAISTVLFDYMNNMLRQGHAVPHEEYFQGLRSLTAESWLEMFS